ncbi:hypothetical protein [Halococcus saccharolyticus]|uniref:Uncharacterized protein n=1 Tax=Halococcus saccharolyticus DSM 5350 TaxID=1227455 RepID=M0MJA5_9EURY|nr:hypothetical protein [Halococcus saccharolyticus]EMA45761.1 hypothetical protein C449_05846 [Halococcus saccharolyticus DSM 5350]
MADKLTLLELHLHSEDNEFTSDVQLSSDIGELLRDRLGFGTGDSESDTEFSTDADDETSFETDTDVDTDTSFESEPDAGVDPLGADGGSGGAVQATDDEETGDTVVEIDEDVADEEDGESSGSALRKLFVLGLLVGLALVAKWYLGGDDLEDEFAMDDDEFGVDDSENEFEEL